jgi:hypothetical protein
MGTTEVTPPADADPDEPEEDEQEAVYYESL